MLALGGSWGVGIWGGFQNQGDNSERDEPNYYKLSSGSGGVELSAQLFCAAVALSMKLCSDAVPYSLSVSFSHQFQFRSLSPASLSAHPPRQREQAE